MSLNSFNVISSGMFESNLAIFLSRSGLQEYFNKQGFHLVGYGCTTCIGNSGELDESVSAVITENGMPRMHAH